MTPTATMEKQGTGKGVNESVIGVLNKQLANWSVLFVKLHHYHWFVKGQAFFTLHQKFEELYNDAAQHMDELAERVLAIGGKPLSTMKAYLSEASVREAAGNEKAGDMVRAAEQDFRTILGELQQGIRTAQDAGDEGTADMLIAMQESLEKQVWMLSSFNE